MLKTTQTVVFPALPHLYHAATLLQFEPLHGHCVVQHLLLREAGYSGGPSHVGFDWLSCCGSRYKIRVLCEFMRVEQICVCVGIERNVS